MDNDFMNSSVESHDITTANNPDSTDSSDILINTDKKRKDKAVLLRVALICLLLVAAVLTLYWQVNHFEFITFDDPLYIVNNQNVQNGLSLEGLKWAFHLSKAGDEKYWQPLTYITYMMDNQFFGLDSGKYHLSNVVFHLLNTVLLFLVFWLYTRSLWKSFFVAMLFAVHPVNVDSVAWISERNNLLSTFFWMLTLLVYYFYTKKPEFDKYIFIILLYILGLLSKPIIVTLPFVLLLLDFWPLNRVAMAGENFAAAAKSIFARQNLILVLEKIPLFVLSLASIVYGSRSMSSIGAFVTNEMVPTSMRIQNAIVSYVHYILKMFWPKNLTSYYPFPPHIPVWQVLGALVLIAFITFLAFKYIKKYPYFIFGWLWYLGTLIPVSGIIQGGLWPQIAERWAYIPYIGLFIILSWGIPDLLTKVWKREIVICALGFIVIVSLSVRTWAQIGYWKDDFIFFTRALEINNENAIAHNNLGLAYASRKHDTQTALHHFKEAVRLSPSADFYYNIGLMYSTMDRPALSIEYLDQALRLNPNHAYAHYWYGINLSKMGKNDQATEHLNEALRLDPYNINAHYQVGLNLEHMGKINDAMKHYQEALKLNPRNVLVLNQVGNLLFAAGNNKEAIKVFMDSLKANPNNPQAKVGLGIILAKTGNLDEGEKNLTEALKMDPGNAGALGGLAFVLSAKGKTDEAIRICSEAIRKSPKNPDLYNQMGIMLASKGKLDEASTNFFKAIELGPENAAYHYTFGTILAATGRADEAIMQFEAVTRINPEYANAYIDLGDLLIRKGRMNEAIGYLSTALKKDPHQAIALNSLGTAYIKKGEIKKAIQFYRQAVQEKPDYAMAIQNLKNAEMNWKFYQTSLAQIQEAMKTSPNNPALFIKSGDLYRQMGDYDKAVAQYQKALSIQPRNIQAMYGLVLVYSSGEGNYAKALETLQGMRQYQPGNPDIYYNIACLYAKQNKGDESIAWLKQAVEKGFRNWDQIRTDPDLANIRNTAYVKKIVGNK